MCVVRGPRRAIPGASHPSGAWWTHGLPPHPDSSVPAAAVTTTRGVWSTGARATRALGSCGGSLLVGRPRPVRRPPAAPELVEDRRPRVAETTKLYDRHSRRNRTHRDRAGPGRPRENSGRNETSGVLRIRKQMAGHPEPACPPTCPPRPGGSSPSPTPSASSNCRRDLSPADGTYCVGGHVITPSSSARAPAVWNPRLAKCGPAGSGPTAWSQKPVARTPSNPTRQPSRGIPLNA